MRISDWSSDVCSSDLEGVPRDRSCHWPGKWRQVMLGGKETPMPRISFTSNLKRHLACPTAEVAGSTVAAALERVFADNPRLRSYLLDDQGRLRKHVVIYVNQQPVREIGRAHV